MTDGIRAQLVAAMDYLSDAAADALQAEDFDLEAEIATLCAAVETLAQREESPRHG